MKEEVKQIWCEEDKMFYPETKVIDGKTYKLDPEKFVYLQDLTIEFTPEEEELMSQPIDRWGRAWQTFMEENYPADIPMLQGRQLWWIIPRQVDKEVREMWDVLEEQYEKAHPRPTTTFMEIAQWENTKRAEIIHTVMEEVVLKYRGL